MVQNKINIQQLEDAINQLLSTSKDDLVVGKDIVLYDEFKNGQVFKSVNMEKILYSDLYLRFIALVNDPRLRDVDSYSSNIFSFESVANSVHFINAVQQTPGYKICCDFLMKNNLVDGPDNFSGLLYNLWFDREVRNAKYHRVSNSFEHVFSGQIVEQKHEIMGLHNWFKVYMLQKFFDLEIIVTQREEDTIFCSFKMNGLKKERSALYIGVSPAVEFLLLTLVYFAMGSGKHVLKINYKSYKELKVFLFPSRDDKYALITGYYNMLVQPSQ